MWPPETSLALEESLQNQRVVCKSLLMLLLCEYINRVVCEARVNKDLYDKMKTLKMEKLTLIQRLSEMEKLKVQSDLKVKDLEPVIQAQSMKTKKAEANLARQLEETFKLSKVLEESCQEWEQEDSCHVLQQAQTILQLMETVNSLRKRVTELEKEVSSLCRRLHNRKEKIRLQLKEFGRKVKMVSLWRQFRHVLKRNGDTERNLIPAVLQFPL